MGWSDLETLVCVHEDGTAVVYDLFGQVKNNKMNKMGALVYYVFHVDSLLNNILVVLSFFPLIFN